MKRVFLDIDGTLIDCNHGLYEMSEATINGLHKLQENHEAFICSGRTYCFIMDEIKKYPFDGYVVCNGAYVYYKNQCIYKQAMKKECLIKLFEVCKKYGFRYYIETFDKIFVECFDDKTKAFMKKWKMDESYVYDNFDIDHDEIYISLLEINKEEDVEVMIQELQDYFDISRHPGAMSFDLNIKGIHKGLGIEKFMEYCHGDMKDTIAFGDGNNDIEMIETVGLGIAMGNAVEPLKGKADKICKTVLEDGVVTELTNLGLIK